MKEGAVIGKDWLGYGPGDPPEDLEERGYLRCSVGGRGSGTEAAVHGATQELQLSFTDCRNRVINSLTRWDLLIMGNSGERQLG